MKAGLEDAYSISPLAAFGGNRFSLRIGGPITIVSAVMRAGPRMAKGNARGVRRRLVSAADHQGNRFGKKYRAHPPERGERGRRRTRQDQIPPAAKSLGETADL